MADAPLRVADDGGVRTLTLARPERRNALNAELVVALTEALEAARRDDAVHVIVLRGDGPHFCAGGELGGLASGPAEHHAGRLAYVDLLRAFTTVGRPTVAVIQGKALGGGFGLALACDLAIAADDAELGTPEVRLGLFPMMIMPLIIRHVGRKRALELMLTGGRLSAPEALAAGCLNQIAPAAELDDAAAALVGKLRSFSPAVHRLGLQQFHHVADLDLAAGIAAGAPALGVNALLEDAAEGVAAFFERRAPDWKGR